MAFEAGSIVARIKADATNFKSGMADAQASAHTFSSKLQDFGSKLSSFGASMMKTGTIMSAAVTLPIVAMGLASVKAASDLQETLNKVDVSFKDQARTVREWANTSVTSMGLARQSALDAAALFGDMSTSMGLTTEEAAKMSTSLVQLGADLASFKNIPFEQAQIALAGIFTGETESLKRLGIVMTQTNVEAYALTQGFKGNFEALTQAEKVTWRYKYVMDVTKNSQGDFARTADSTANQIRMMQERFKELQTKIGEELLPIANKLLEWVGKAFDWFEKLDGNTKKIILVILGVAAAIGPLLLALGALATALGALAAHPVVLIIAAIVAGIILLGIAVNKIVEHFGGWQAVMDRLKPVFEWFKMAWETIVRLFNERIKPALDHLWQTFQEKLLPKLQEFWERHGPAVMQALGIIAGIIGGTLIVAIYLLIYWLEFMINVWSGVIDAISWVIDQLNMYWDRMVNDWNATVKFVTDSVNAFISFFQNLPYNIGLIVGSVVRWFMELPRNAEIMVNNIINWLNQLPGRAWNAMVNLFNSIVHWLSQLPGWAQNAASNMVNGFIGWVSSLPGRVWGIMAQVANTIGGFGSWLWEQGRRIAASVWEGFKKGLGIRSPSYIEKAFMAIQDQASETLYQMTKDVNQLNRITSNGLEPMLAGAMNNQTNTTFNAPIYIGNEADGDNLIQRISRNQELADQGITTRGYQS
jgi:phage-related protein